jgi:hypothetical protein
MLIDMVKRSLRDLVCVLSSAVPVCAVDRQARMSGPELLEAVGNAERERAAVPDEVPLGEWEAVRVRPDCNAPLISQALLANAEEAKSLLQVPHCTLLAVVSTGRIVLFGMPSHDLYGIPVG